MHNRSIFFHYIIVTVLLIMLSYPLFYFSYKFCLPDFGGEDYFYYQHLYSNWDFEKVPSPFNMRIISSFFIFLFNKIGLYYDTKIVFTSFHPELDQQVFFNAILFNYICVIFTCLVIFKLIDEEFGNKVYSFAGACTYLLGFGTLFFSLKPLSEACGILLIALTFYFYRKRSPWMFLFLLVSIMQREYIYFVFAIIGMVDFYYNRKRYYILTVLASVVLFFVYVILRKTFFYTPHFEYQMTISTFIHSILNPQIDLSSFVKQSFLLSNLLFLYYIVILYKNINQFSFNKNYFINITLLFIHVILMSIMACFGNNVGRYFYYTAPILIYYLFIELKPLVISYLKTEKNV